MPIDSFVLQFRIQLHRFLKKGGVTYLWFLNSHKMNFVPYEIFDAAFSEFKDATDEQLCKRPWPKAYRKATTWQDIQIRKSSKYEERRRLVAGEDLSRWCSFQTLSDKDVESYGLGMQLSDTWTNDVKILTDVWAIYNYSELRSPKNRSYVQLYFSTAHWNGTKWRLGPTWKSFQDHTLNPDGTLNIEFKNEFDRHRTAIMEYTKPLQANKKKKEDALRAKRLQKHAQRVQLRAAKLRAQATNQ